MIKILIKLMRVVIESITNQVTSYHKIFWILRKIVIITIINRLDSLLINKVGWKNTKSNTLDNQGIKIWNLLDKTLFKIKVQIVIVMEVEGLPVEMA